VTEDCQKRDTPPVKSMLAIMYHALGRHDSPYIDENCSGKLEGADTWRLTGAATDRRGTGGGGFASAL
jgi:hypothetical protein